MLTNETLRYKVYQACIRNKVTPVLAAVVGSRAWGTASENSDYDIHFIYKHSQHRYLSMHAPKDVIDIKEDSIEGQGWDIRKFGLLLAKGNPTALTLLRVEPLFNHIPKIAGMAESLFNDGKLVQAYGGISVGDFTRTFEASKVLKDRIKTLLSGVRNTLNLKWVITYGTMPPLKYHDVLTVEQDLYIRNLLIQLLEAKLAARDLDKGRLQDLHVWQSKVLEASRCYQPAHKPSENTLLQLDNEIINTIVE